MISKYHAKRNICVQFTNVSPSKSLQWAPKVYPSQNCRYSINTEGALLHSKLKSKAYLRITMGEDMGKSPGIPYVLEIWPKGRVKHFKLFACCEY
jgi:hypothetical protein